MNKIYTRDDFFNTIKIFNEIMPDIMSEKWINILYECFKEDSKIYLRECKNIVSKYEYGVMMKDEPVVIPIGIYFIMLDRIPKVRLKLTSNVQAQKIKRRRKRIEESRKYWENKKKINNIEKTSIIIGELYKND